VPVVVTCTTSRLSLPRRSNDDSDTALTRIRESGGAARGVGAGGPSNLRTDCGAKAAAPGSAARLNRVIPAPPRASGRMAPDDIMDGINVDDGNSPGLRSLPAGPGRDDPGEPGAIPASP